MTRLIVFGGLPGVGKTTLAKHLARHQRAVYLRIDSIEQALARSTMAITPAEDAGYQAAYAIALDNLVLGLDVVADSVNPVPETREAWLSVARQSQSTPLQVEVICSDLKEHRQRIETRSTDIAGLQLPTWYQVQQRTYHPWPGTCLVVDTAHRSVEEALNEVIDAIGTR